VNASTPKKIRPRRNTTRRTTVLKKTGIIVSVVAAGALGLGGLAFAHEAPHQDAPANITTTQDDNVGNNCDFGQAGSLVDQDLVGGNGTLAAAAGAVTGIAAPVDAQTQALNCANASFSNETNSNSGNTVRQDTRTETVDSGNTDS
jgi:hypothetical protein